MCTIVMCVLYTVYSVYVYVHYISNVYTSTYVGRHVLVYTCVNYTCLHLCALHMYMYCTAGNFGGTKFWLFTKFGDWRICGHVPLSMCIMAQNGGFLFW